MSLRSCLLRVRTLRILLPLSLAAALLVSVSPMLSAQPLWSHRTDADEPVVARVGAAVLAGTETLVYDELEGHIVRLDRTGAVRQRIGAKGSGPGEFRSVRWLGLGANDSLYVWDGSQRRLSVFARNGRFVRAEVPEHTESDPAVAGRLRNGQWVIVTRGERALREAGVDLTQSLLTVGVARSVRERPTPVLTVPSKKFASVTVGTNTFMRELPAMEMHYVSVCENGFLVGSGAQRQVEAYDAKGTRLATVRLTRAPSVITGAARRGTIESGAGVKRDGGASSTPPAVAAAFAKAFDAVIPAEMPSSEQFVFGTDRSVWVWPNIGFMVWQQLGRDGAAGPSLPFAARGAIVAATAEHLLISTYDENERLELWARPAAFAGPTAGLPASLGRCSGALVQ